MGFESNIGFPQFNITPPMSNGVNFPMFTQQFNLPNFNFNTPVFNGFQPPIFSYNSNSTSAKTDSTTDIEAQRQARYKKDQEEFEQRMKKIQELLNLKTEAVEAKKELEEQKKQIAMQAKPYNNAKVNPDGSAMVVENLNEIKEKKGSFELWKRGLMNAFNGTFNVLKSMAGYDNKRKKWDPVKCLRNVGIAVGGGALCAIAGPAGGFIAVKLGGGVIATAIGAGVASIPTVLAGAGVAAGGVMLCNAAKKLDNAIDTNDTQKFDEATQDIGAGLTVGISSLSGLRSVGRGAGTWSQGKGVFGNIGSWLKNTFVNPFKGTWKNTEIARDAVIAARDAARTASAGKGTVAKYFAGAKGYLKGMKDANVKLGTQKAEVGKKEFEELYNNSVTKIQNKIQELDMKIAVYRTSGDTKGEALALLQKNNFENILTKMNDAKTYKDWTAFTKLLNGQLKDINKMRNNYYKLKLGGKKFWKKDGIMEVNGQKFDATDSNFARALLKEMRAAQKEVNKTVREVRHKRIESMYEMGKKKFYNDEVKDFGFSTNAFWRKIPLLQNPINIFKKEIYKWRDLSHNKMETIAGHAFLLLDPIFLLNHYVGDREAMPLHLMMLEQPYYEASEGNLLSADELAQAKTEFEEAEKQIQAKIDDCDKILNASA